MPSNSLSRLAGWAGLASAAILLLNAARRGGLIPDNLPVTHALAPLAEAFGLLLVTGLFLAARRSSGALGTLGTLGFTLNFLGMAALVGVEFILNFIFPELTKAQISTLRDGLTGTVFTGSSLLFLTGVLLFAFTLWRTTPTPRAAIAAYALGAVPVSLRGVLPAPTLPIGLVLLACGVGWLGLTLTRPTPALEL